MKGKKCLVTGAGAGIGRTLSKKLHEMGVEVYALSRTLETLESLQKECPGIHIIQQDIAKWDETRQKVLDLPVMDMLVNNAGAGDQNLFLDVPEGELDKLWAINVKPVVNLGQVVAKKVDRSKQTRDHSQCFISSISDWHATSHFLWSIQSCHGSNHTGHGSRIGPQGHTD